jgi:uncharacterized protein (DUF2141 family)
MHQRTITAPVLWASLAALPLGLSCPLAEAQERGVTLRVQVSSFRNTKGTLNCRLFTQPSTFPNGEGGKSVRVAIEGTEASCTFEDVGPGTYAIAVVHDENGNGRLDKNLFGVPVEGYGVSNNRTYAMSSPKWNESKFEWPGTESAVQRVSLRY